MRLEGEVPADPRCAVCAPLRDAGDLFALLHMSELGQLPETQCRFYTACVGLAIKHIHSMGFLYCDIKLENVLITSDGYVKLCDFGLAKKLTVARKSRFLPSFCTGEARSYSKCGTDQYAPPEVVSGSGRAKGADWWALGVLLHEMLTGHSPFEGKGMAEIFARVEEYANGGAEAGSLLRSDVMEVREPPRARPCTVLRGEGGGGRGGRKGANIGYGSRRAAHTEGDGVREALSLTAPPLSHLPSHLPSPLPACLVRSLAGRD
jgi:serine/threonine protein kinase